MTALASVPVLMYHSVTDQPSSSTRTLSVRPADLDLQLHHLRDEGFTGLTFGGLCELARNGAELPTRPVVLTFDDGYADNHEQVLPLLSDRGFPATVFVTTGWVRDAVRWAAGRPLDRTLSWAQIHELRDAGIEIAAHSPSHSQLDQLAERRLRCELDLSKALLEDCLAVPVDSMAYPYGYSSRRVRRTVEGAGYDQAAVVDNDAIGPNCTYFAAPRLTAGRSTSQEVFARIVACDDIQRIFTVDRMLTRVWAVVRRMRYALRKVRGG